MSTGQWLREYATAIAAGIARRRQTHEGAIRRSSGIRQKRKLARPDRGRQMGMRRCASVARWAPREVHVAVARHRAGFGDWRVLPRGPGRAMAHTRRESVASCPTGAPEKQNASAIGSTRPRSVLPLRQPGRPHARGPVALRPWIAPGLPVRRVPLPYSVGYTIHHAAESGNNYLRSATPRLVVLTNNIANPRSITVRMERRTDLVPCTYTAVQQHGSYYRSHVSPGPPPSVCRSFSSLRAGSSK
jgi:hypothetical protein